MEPFDFPCPHCGGKLRVKLPQLIGRKVNCPKCGDTFRVTEPVHDDELAYEGDQASSVGSNAFNFAGASSAKAGVSDIPNFESSGFQSYDEEEAAELSQYDYDSEDEEYEEYESTSTYTPRPKPSNLVPMLIGAGIPAGIGLILCIAILASKGYFSFGGSSNRREDGRRFQEFAQSVSSNDWRPQEPTAEVTRLSRQLDDYISDYPGSQKLVNFKQRLSNLQRQRANNTLTVQKFAQALAGLQSDIQDELREIDPDKFGPARDRGSRNRSSGR